MTTASTALSPNQADIHRRLLDPGGDRPVFPTSLRADLRAELEGGLSDIADGFSREDPLYMNKYDLAGVHACEAFLVANDAAGFSWTTKNVKGRLVHRALQDLVEGRYETEPRDAVEGALAHLADGDAELADFLSGLDRYDRLDVLHEAIEIVVKFVEDWPPIEPEWKPQLEWRTKASLCHGHVVVSGNYDLRIGRARAAGDDHWQARVLVVEFKTGWQRTEDRDDLRLYALLETLTRGCPPHRTVTYYPDEGRCIIEDVTEDLLRSAVRRLLDGAAKIAKLRTGGYATRTPNGRCNYCPDADNCGPGQEWLAERRERYG